MRTLVVPQLAERELDERLLVTTASLGDVLSEVVAYTPKNLIPVTLHAELDHLTWQVDVAKLGVLALDGQPVGPAGRVA